MDAGADAAGVVSAGAFTTIFFIIIGAAVLAALSSFVLFVYVKRNRARLEANAAADADADAIAQVNTESQE
jgi:hypothetical protein